jgi:hypothetical protein
MASSTTLVPVVVVIVAAALLRLLLFRPEGPVSRLSRGAGCATTPDSVQEEGKRSTPRTSSSPDDGGGAQLLRPPHHCACSRSRSGALTTMPSSTALAGHTYLRIVGPAAATSSTTARARQSAAAQSLCRRGMLPPSPPPPPPLPSPSSSSSPRPSPMKSPLSPPTQRVHLAWQLTNVGCPSSSRPRPWLLPRGTRTSCERGRGGRPAAVMVSAGSSSESPSPWSVACWRCCGRRGAC